MDDSGFLELLVLLVDFGLEWSSGKMYRAFVCYSGGYTRRIQIRQED